MWPFSLKTTKERVDSFVKEVRDEVMALASFYEVYPLLRSQKIREVYSRIFSEWQRYEGYPHHQERLLSLREWVLRKAGGNSSDFTEIVK